MPRPQATRNDSRSQHIREAARKLFIQKGFTATTTDDVAREAGLSKATLYARYASKEELLTDVLKDVVAQLATLPLEVQAGTPEVQLIQLAEGLLNALMNPSYLALIRVLIAELPHQPALGELFSQAVPLQILSRMQGLLSQVLPTIHPAEENFLAARSFVGPLLTFVLLDGLLVAQPTPPSKATLEQLVSQYLSGVTRQSLQGGTHE